MLGRGDKCHITQVNVAPQALKRKQEISSSQTLNKECDKVVEDEHSRPGGREGAGGSMRKSRELKSEGHLAILEEQVSSWLMQGRLPDLAKKKNKFPPGLLGQTY